MEKTIRIGDTEVKLSNSVAWTMEYRDQFGKDIIPSLIPLLSSITETITTIIADSDIKPNKDGKLNADALKSIAEAIQGRAVDILLPLFQLEFVDIAINVTWAMAKAADGAVPEPKIWVRKFDTFPLDEIAPEVIKLVIKGFVSSKNLSRLKNAAKSLKSLQPSHLTTSSSQELSEV